MKTASISQRRVFWKPLPLLAGMALSLLLTSCRSDSTSSPLPPSSGSQSGALTSIEKVEQSCIRSGALWDPLFFSCTCLKANEVFVNEVGCRALSFTPSTQACLDRGPDSIPAAECFSTPFQTPLALAEKFSFASASLSAPERVQLASDFRSGKIFRLLQGRVFRAATPSQAASGPRIQFVTVAPFGTPAYQNGRIVGDGKEAPVVLWSLASDPQLDAGAHLDSSACEQALGTKLPAAPAARACELLRFGMDSLALRKFELPQDLKSRGSTWITRGDGCYPSCQHFTQLASTLAQSPEDPQTLTFAVDFLPDFIPYKRTLTVSSRTFSIRALLTAQGALEGFELESIEALAKDLDTALDEQRLIQNRKSAWNAAFSELRADTSESSGSFEKLTSKIRALRDTPVRDRGLSLMPHEDPTRIRRGEVRALIVDSGIDLGAPGLAPRFSFAPQALESFPSVLNQNTFFQWLDGAIFSGLPSAQVVLPGLIQNAHGTEVASVLTRDLPDAQISWFPANDRLDFEALRAAIRNVQPRLVNFSVTLADERPDCIAGFDALFEEFPEVLFVAGAGNTGSRNPSTCPARSAAKDSARNALAVAGTATGLPGSRLDPASSRGESVAKLAAAFRPPCLHQIAEDQYEVSQCAGTSFASPFVGNLALKLWTQDPRLGTQEVISRIHAECLNDPSLAVGWHCAIPLSAAGEHSR